jgi:hypothetical protein
MITPLVVQESNLSVAWARAFLELMEPGAHLRHPAVITISGFDNAVGVEDSRIRALLDAELKKHGKNSCKTVAGTIFPSSMWNPALTDDRDALFRRYDRAWPGIKKCPQNRRGVYFRRLTAFQPKNSNEKPVNQLDIIIRNFNGGTHRKSALQASIFDPSRDHINAPFLGFPCLQQVAFTPVGEGHLSVTGYYAKQLHLEKAYGNYLGLYELGRFMAKQLGLTLSQVVCIASCLERSDSNFTKSALTPLKMGLETLLPKK